MDSKEMDVQRLQNIIDTSTNPKAVERAKKQLEGLSSIGSAQVQLASNEGGSEDPQLNAIMNMLQQVVSSKGLSSTTASVNPSEVRSLILKELATRKIELDDLSNSLKAWLNSMRNVTLTINANGVITKNVAKGSSELNSKLAQLILSDASAKNNTYLYGSAGTGKTYIAGLIAKQMNYKLITLNCNQYTSPLDIVGGQTIDGYQEGKLVIAWSNKQKMEDGSIKEYEGCVLLLDELPKIDPNTAGILNEALAKVKQYSVNDVTKELIPPTILNGKNQEFYLGNMIVIATGNVPLNTIDPDYEANFKQDLSLQDRFIGSTYKVFYNYRNEFERIMNGYAFIFIFLVKVREAINDPSIRATSQAFVSTRLMENARQTYFVYRDVTQKNKSVKTASIITSPKTLEDTMETFFELFKPAQKQAILDKVDYEGFKKIIAEKNKMAFDEANPNFDTPQEKQEGEAIVTAYEQANKNKI
jgi:cobaltochelatase CobS